MDKKLTEEELRRDETIRLIASDMVEGTPVYNGQGEHLGSIEKLMIEKVSGKVSYAVMSFGGFLGIGEEHHPLPWNILSYDIEKGGYVVTLTREQLEGAPRFKPGEEHTLDDREHAARLEDYYRTPGGMSGAV